MINTRYFELNVLYEKTPLVDEVGAEIESMSYTDSAADNSDSLEITINAQDSKWASDKWMPYKGASLYAAVTGYHWEGKKDNKGLECGLFVLDDIAYNDTPTTLRLNGVAKPADTNFSELERQVVWSNTTIKRIGGDIAKRYGLGYSYDADDYSIDGDEQDDTDSSYLNDLCKRYGLILKVYAKHLWIYDREKYKGKLAVRNYDRKDIIQGSFSFTNTLSGTFTGGTFSYTDPDKNCDITAWVGGGTHTKNVSRRATSVFDAQVQLCAEINNANHGTCKCTFAVPGDWDIASSNCITLTGYGRAINGKYYIDKVTHSFDRGGGFKTTLDCSRVDEPFYYWEVGGDIQFYESDHSSSTSYNSSYAHNSPAASMATAAATNAAAAAGAKTVAAKQAVTLSNAPFYYTSTAPNPSCYKSGTFYFYDGILVNNRYRITNSPDRCEKLPVGKNVTGWVPAEYCS